jgi:hypothetical protein
MKKSAKKLASITAFSLALAPAGAIFLPRQAIGDDLSVRHEESVHEESRGMPGAAVEEHKSVESEQHSSRSRSSSPSTDSETQVESHERSSRSVDGGRIESSHERKEHRETQVDD